MEKCLYREALERPDMVSQESPDGLRIIQITTSDKTSSSHVYMESYVFTPDSRRFIFQRFRNPQETDPRRMVQDYMLCDVADGCSFRQITDEIGATGPSVTPDGKYAYYIVDHSKPGEGWWSVMRVDLGTLKRETILKVDVPLAGAGSRMSRLYNLTSISSDGKRLCTSGYLGDGKTRNAPWGLVVIDLEKATTDLVLDGQSFCNMHPQYCRSRDPAAARDILVQDNHGCDIAENGDIVTLVSGAGADIHVIRDDGSAFRSMPWGRDGNEYCQGHQAWRGEMLSAVTSTSILSDGTSTLIEGHPAEVTQENAHDGLRIPGGRRNDLSRNIQPPYFCHFAFDPSGTKYISDTSREDGRIVVGTIPDTPDAALTAQTLLYHKSSFGRPQYTHPHPFLSPDGKRAFFNSDESGLAQVYMATGFESAMR